MARFLSPNSGLNTNGGDRPSATPEVRDESPPEPRSSPVRLPASATLQSGAYKYTQTVREVMAVLNLANTAGNLLGGVL